MQGIQTCIHAHITCNMHVPLVFVKETKHIMAFELTRFGFMLSTHAHYSHNHFTTRCYTGALLKTYKRNPRHSLSRVLGTLIIP